MKLKLLFWIFVIFILSSFVSADIDDRILHWWNCEDSNMDDLGYLNVSNLVNMTQNPTGTPVHQAGVLGNGCFFGGNSGYEESGGAITALGSGAYTIMQWWNTTTSSSIQTVTNFDSMQTYPYSDGNYYCYYNGNSGWESVNTPYSANTLYFTLRTYNSSGNYLYECHGGNCTMYSTQISTLLNLATYSSGDDDDSSIGINPTGIRSLYGMIDEVAIFNDSFSYANVTRLYNNGNALKYDEYYSEPNYAPSFDTFEISNSAPILTNDVIDLQFNVSDAENDTLNISITWFYSTDNSTWTAHVTDNESWNNQGNSTYIGNLYHTSATGDLEAADTSAYQYWKAQGTVTDGTATAYKNSSVIFITNNLPSIDSSTSGTTNDDPADKGNSILFNITATDAEGDTTYMKICQNYGENWTNCTILCQNSSGVALDTVNPTQITCSYTTTEDTREHTGYALLYDGGDYTNMTNISYYVNQYPTLTNFQMADTYGGTTYYFGEYIDYFNIDQNDTYDNSTLTSYITVYDPDNVVKINNQAMTEGSGITDEYTTNLYLDAVGTWNVTITVTDSDGASTTYSTTFSVTKTNVSTSGRIYGYDFETLPSYTSFNETLDSYEYYLGEIRINTSSNWSEISNLIQLVKNQSQVLILTLEDDLTSQSTTLDFISQNYADLIDGNHLNAMSALKIHTTASEDAANSAVLNNITKRMFQNVSNKIPIYIRRYNHSDINTDYARIDTQTYITAASQEAWINLELGYLKNSTSETRIYYDLSDSLKNNAMNWQSDVIDKFRSSLTLNFSINDSNIAELSNGDFILVNNQSSQQQYDITLPASYIGYDLYNLNTHKIIETETDGNISVNISGYSGNIIYKTNITSIKVDSDDDIYVYGKNDIDYPATLDLAQNSANAFQFVGSSANSEDARLTLLDSSYIDAGFYIWYGTNGAEAIANFTRYDYVILADTTNQSWIETIANDSSTEVYGYTSVNTYGNNNYPLGCTSGVNCTLWNRSYWIDTKLNDIETWTNMSNLNVFIDGLDIGAVNDVDNLFEDALVEMTDYIKITKGRKAILNTYTSYQNYANLGDITMRESACGRWDGSVNNPTYSYENISLEVERARFHKTHNLPVFAQAFGNITDHEKSYYCYMQTKVLYGDLAEFGYNQPKFEYTDADDDFQWNYFKYPDLGSTLEDDYSVDGDVYTRRYENGIVSVNTTSHTVDYQTDTAITQMQFCAYYYDNDDGASDEGYMHFVINDNQSRYFNVVDTDLTQAVKTWKCVNISTDYYEPSGFYELEFYYIDSDGNYLNNNGLYMYHGSTTGNDRLSFWDNTLNDHPVNDETDYTYYTTGDNWVSNFTINAVSTGSTLDQVDSVITRTETGIEEKTITLSSDTHWDIEVYDKLVFMNKTIFNGIKVNGTYLNYTNSSACITDNPTYTSSTIGSDIWKACYYDSNGATEGYYVKVVVPHLSTQNYTIDGNTPPEINNESISLISLTGNNQTWTLTYNYSDADSNNITLCKVDSAGLTFLDYPINDSCFVQIYTTLNETSYSARPYVIDEYGAESTNGQNFTLATILYDTIAESSLVGNLTTQYFSKYYNITQNQGNFTSISWSYNNMSAASINLSNGTTRNFLNYSTNIITYGEYGFTPDANGTYVVNGGETIYRYFNVSGNLSTGEDIPVFYIDLEQQKYVSGTQAMYSNCSSYSTYSNFTTGSNMISTIQSLSNSSTSCYQYTYQGKVVYSDSEVVYNDSGSTRTYIFNNSENNSYGRKIEFMFDSLNASTTKVKDYIDYSTLPNWASKTSSSQKVNRYWSPTTTYTAETNGVDYTYNDDASSSIVKFDWTSLNTPLDALYINLSWTATVTTYQCNDGIDNDGDGLIDYPNDPDCSSATDDTESTASSGGSTGGSSSSSSIDLNAEEVCKIEIDPSIVKFRENGIIKVTVFNKGTKSYEPSFEFTGDLIEYLSVTNTFELLPGEAAEFGIKYLAENFTEGESRLILTDANCGKATIYIKASDVAKPISIVEDLFDNEKIGDFLTEPVFSEDQEPYRSKTPFFTIGVILFICSMISSLIFYVPTKKTVSDDKYGLTILWILFAFTIAFILTIFIVTLIRYF